jgi:DNA-binding NarL/FixJ family response regulator
VLYVEDNPQVADAIAHRFARVAGVSWLGVLPTADELVERSIADRPHVVILDLDLPGICAITALRNLSALPGSPRVVIFSGKVDQGMIDAAVQAGAWGYVSKHDGEDAIVDAVSRVLDDEFVLSPEARQVYDQR